MKSKTRFNDTDYSYVVLLKIRCTLIIIINFTYANRLDFQGRYYTNYNNDCSAM